MGHFPPFPRSMGHFPVSPLLSLTRSLSSTAAAAVDQFCSGKQRPWPRCVVLHAAMASVDRRGSGRATPPAVAWRRLLPAASRRRRETHSALGKLTLWRIDDEEQHSENHLHAMMEVESGTYNCYSSLCSL
ncbi:hypothetical protein SORBI_3008G005700 [Sorghum bicolor]|uniref:Uncharacterized protein n=2 Tax=Sorghum bicolor TaxID=4558 RepID=A0A1B6PBF4_SORBI|nr:hypothetical protein SORBI_3008G005700 [Sorghum bicolor]